MRKDLRTSADSKYRPKARRFSRYGRIESALQSLKDDPELGDKEFTARIISKRSGVGNGISVGMIFGFTKGIESTGKGTYRFNGDEIKVDNSKGSSIL